MRSKPSKVLLVLLLCLSLCINVFAVSDSEVDYSGYSMALQGSAIAVGSGGGGPTSGGGSTGSFGAMTGIVGYRMRGVTIDNLNSYDYGYFFLHPDKKVVNMKDNITGVSGYNDDLTKWFYWQSNDHMRQGDYFCNGDKNYPMIMCGTLSWGYKRLCNILGVNSFLSAGEITSGLNNYKNYMAGAKDELADFLGVDKDKPYFIIVEALTAVGYVGNRYGWAWESYQNSMYKDPNGNVVANTPNGNHPNAVNVIRNTNRIDPGAKSPFTGYEYQKKTHGYAIFGDFLAKAAKNPALNIAVEYQGAPNTNDASKFKVDTSIVKQGDKSKGTLQYWNGQAWVESKKAEELLNIKNVDTSNKMSSMVFSNTYGIRATENVSLDTILAKGNNLGANLSLTWGDRLVNTGAANIGYKVVPVSVNNRMDAAGIVGEFTDNLPMYAQNSKNTLATNHALPIIDGIYNNLNLAMKNTDTGCLDSQQTTLQKNKALGVGVEFIARGVPVESKKVTVVAGTDVSLSTTWSQRYNTSTSGMFSVDSGACALVYVPTSQANDEAIRNTVTECLTDDAFSVTMKLKNALGGSAKSLTNVAGTNVAIGCTGGANIEGYTVYEIIIDGTQLEQEEQEGEVTLPPYMLNMYYDDIVQTASSNVGSTVSYSLKSDWTHDKSKDVKRNCEISGDEFVIQPGKDYRISFTDTSSTSVFGKDAGSLLQSYYPFGTGVWDKSKRTSLVGGVTVDTEHLPSPSTIDYAYNFVRANSNDVRTISGVSNADYETATGDTNNMLGLKAAFGVKPKVTVKPTAAANTNAQATPFKETFNVTGRYVRNGSTTGEKDGSWAVHAYHYTSHTCEHEDGYSHTVIDQECGPFDYIASWSRPDIKCFWRNSAAVSAINYTWANIPKKYIPADKGVGKNSNMANGSNILGVDTNAIKATEGSFGTNAVYRYAACLANGTTLKFYPDVRMVYKVGGTTFENTVPYKVTNTLGEVERSLSSNSLYLFKVKTTNTQPVTGSTVSDSMQGGSSSLGSSRVALPAGSDVTVATKLNGLDIDLYGYSLDVIDKSIDGTMRTGASTTLGYSSIVKSNQDLYSAWMGNSNKDHLKAHFTNWANNLLKAENFAADYNLVVDGVETSSNFSAVVGNITRNATVAEEGVYPLVIENGEIVKTKGAYTNLIAQIAADYSCSEAEAEQVFDASGMATTMLNAIESSISDTNRSGNCAVNTAWTSVLGNDTNWYDEKVYTFVVRRFTNTGNKVKDITASDKIDYSLGATSGFKNAEWTLNLYWNKDKASVIDNALFKTGTYYDYTQGNEGMASANDAYSVMLYKVPVEKADFNIASSSTQNFKH